MGAIETMMRINRAKEPGSAPSCAWRKAAKGARVRPRQRIGLSVLALIAAGLSASAHAESREVRIGVLQHDVLHLRGRENGADIEVQLLGRPMPSLARLGEPRPVAVVAVNSDGETSFAAIGLVWRREVALDWTAEVQFGYAIHDGELDGTTGDRLLLGSRDLFRTQFGLDYRLSGSWSAGVQWDHLSHGQILGQGRNQGIDAAGFRLTRRY